MTTQQDNRKCPGSARWLLALLPLLAGCAFTASDSPLGESDFQSLGDGPSLRAPAPTAEAAEAVPVAAAAADSVMAEIPAQMPTVPSISDLLAERPDLAQLEDLLSGALRMLARSQLEPARDVLFLLKEEATAAVPADRDSLAASYLRSLGRRVTLLAGVLAEQEVLQASVADEDSLLNRAYADLRGFSFPDSLIPLTLPQRRAIEADLITHEDERVTKWIHYYTHEGREQMTRWLTRKAAVEELVGGMLAEAGLPQELIYLAVIESGLNPRARSNVGAVGPWQFMPGTARHFHLRCDWWVDERRDLEMSTRAAVNYMSQLYNRFGDWALVLAAYNSGEGRVERAVNRAGLDNFWQLPLPWETRNHIPKFIAAARIGADPEAFGITPGEVTSLAYDVVNVTDATDLALIAECAGIDQERLRELNPALLRGATPPGNGDYPVRVPVGTGVAAMRRLRAVPLAERLTWRRHTVQRGETLGHIARAYGTTVRDLTRLNTIGNAALIHPGDKLLIPMPAALAERSRLRTAEAGHYVPPEGYGRVSYRVRAGDTLTGIAQRLGVSLSHLRRVNNIHGTSLIKPGQRLYAYRPTN